jgi:hypothetical protein
MHLDEAPGDRGTKSKEDTGAGFDDITGSKSHGQGYVVNTWANGDKSYVRTQGSATLKDGTIERAEGTEFYGRDRQAEGR